jgi:hypothetical protein
LLAMLQKMEINELWLNDCLQKFWQLIERHLGIIVCLGQDFRILSFNVADKTPVPSKHELTVSIDRQVRLKK